MSAFEPAIRPIAMGLFPATMMVLFLQMTTGPQAFGQTRWARVGLVAGSLGVFTAIVAAQNIQWRELSASSKKPSLRGSLLRS